MDLSKFNFETILMLAVAIALAYLAIKVISNVVYKIISLGIGILILAFAFNKLGISVPIISQLSDYVFNGFSIGFEVVKDFIGNLK